LIPIHFQASNPDLNKEVKFLVGVSKSDQNTTPKRKKEEQLHPLQLLVGEFSAASNKKYERQRRGTICNCSVLKQHAAFIS
jgi:hypothetical protein